MIDDAEWYATLDRIRANVARDLNAQCREYGWTLAQVAVLVVLTLPSQDGTG